MGHHLKLAPTQDRWLRSAIKQLREQKPHRMSGCGRLIKREPVPFFKFSTGAMQILFSFPYLQKRSLLAYLKIFYVQNKLDLVYVQRCTVAYHTDAGGSTFWNLAVLNTLNSIILFVARCTTPLLPVLSWLTHSFSHRSTGYWFWNPKWVMLMRVCVQQFVYTVKKRTQACTDVFRQNCEQNLLMCCWTTFVMFLRWYRCV